VLGRREHTSLLEVSLHTGRHHQIRVQLAAAGHPVVGDLRYGADAPLSDRTIALHSERLALDHPVRGERVVLTAPPPVDNAPWLDYRSAILGRFE
jgi:23S rRNA pseudouridine1911/1915/1917 synthase